MNKGDLIVGKVVMNPVGNKLTPCIKLIMWEGLCDEELVLLEVKNSAYAKELNDGGKV